MTTKNTRAQYWPVFWIELILPRKNYTVGDQIDYEVIVHDTDGRSIQSLTITLYQNIIQVVNKSRGIRSKDKTSLNIVKHRIARRETTRGYAVFGENWSWKDSLKIPTMLSPSMAASDSTVQLNEQAGIQAAAIQYFLKVHAAQPETFPITSEEYPIQIQSAKRVASPPNSISISSSNLQFGTSVPSSGGRPLQRSGGDSIESTPQHFPLRQLGPSDPPRYSALSLPALNYGIMAGRSGSVETLPPNYEDIILQ